MKQIEFFGNLKRVNILGVQTPYIKVPLWARYFIHSMDLSNRLVSRIVNELGGAIEGDSFYIGRRMDR